MDIASLVIAIISIILSFLPCVNWLGLALAIVSVILGFIARSKAQKENKPTGVATAGIVIGFIAIGLFIVVLCVTILTVGVAAALDM